MADLGVWTVDGDAPRRVARSRVDLEKNLEDWIASDASLLADGLTVVGRQVWLDGGPLDLLAIDWQDRWVVIELKRERLYRDAITQALDYASSIAQMDSEDLEALLRPGLAALGDAEELSQTVRRQLEGEDGAREVAVLLAGVGVDAGLERIVAHLGGYGVPISIVSFEVFEPQDGPRLLIREVTEEDTRPPRRSGRRYSVEAVRRLAAASGLGEQFDRFVAMAEAAGLAVQPLQKAVRIAPLRNRTRFLIYAGPRDSGMFLPASPEAFAEFFPPLTPDEVTAAIGPYLAHHPYEGADLDARLDQIEAFLNTLPRTNPADAD